MKTKIGWMTLPLLCVANLALAQEAVPTNAAAPAGTAEAPAMAQAPAQMAPSKPMRRQGRDMRRCLKLKTNEAIIRCAESGRKP
ncbi:MAG: hypothetical protein HZY77_04560 [Thiobacillus sp.]|uniref:hypothetical protein n=1 Tax=Thiobacillus sp. TaxID=924 RepID=UPI00168C2E24|nr:hypothetical protein [Thiobacillus sp.]QLQ02220.1 MAG: hypothetical protein HZY77_04560 [Thiobacillus sp.]